MFVHLNLLLFLTTQRHTKKFACFLACFPKKFLIDNCFIIKAIDIMYQEVVFCVKKQEHYIY